MTLLLLMLIIEASSHLRWNPLFRSGVVVIVFFVTGRRTTVTGWVTLKNKFNTLHIGETDNILYIFFLNSLL